MSSKLKVLQVIPKLGYGGAETGCYDLAHYLHEQNCSSYIVTSGGELLKYVNKKKVKVSPGCSKKKYHPLSSNPQNRVQGGEATSHPR